jgi:hypothetical protein
MGFIYRLLELTGGGELTRAMEALLEEVVRLEEEGE